MIRQNALKYATTRNGAYVLIHVLSHGDLEDCNALASDMLAWSSDLADVAGTMRPLGRELWPPVILCISCNIMYLL